MEHGNSHQNKSFTFHPLHLSAQHFSHRRWKQNSDSTSFWAQTWRVPQKRKLSVHKVPQLSSSGRRQLWGWALLPQQQASCWLSTQKARRKQRCCTPVPSAATESQRHEQGCQVRKLCPQNRRPSRFDFCGRRTSGQGKHWGSRTDLKAQLYVFTLTFCTKLLPTQLLLKGQGNSADRCKYNPPPGDSDARTFCCYRCCLVPNKYQRGKFQHNLSEFPYLS